MRGLEDQERIAALERDVTVLEQRWSDEFIVKAPNNQVVAGKRAVMDTFLGAGVINFSMFERKENGTWRLFARHANVIPKR